MKTKNFLLQLFIFLSINLKAQTPDWGFYYAGTAESEGRITLKADGNNIFSVVSYNDGNIDVDPGSGSQVYSDSGGYGAMAVCKYSPDGNLIWSIPFISTFDSAGISSSYISQALSDQKGDLYLLGHASDSMDLDPGSGTDYYIEDEQFYFLAKYSSNGNLLWTKKISGCCYLSILGMKFCNSYVTIYGQHSGSIDMDDDIVSIADIMVDSSFINAQFLAFYDTSGNYLNAKIYDGSFTSDISGSPDNTFYVSYYLNQDFDLDFNASQQMMYLLNGRNVIAQYSSSWNLLNWVQFDSTSGGSSGLSNSGIYTNQNQNIFLSGSFEQSCLIGDTIVYSSGAPYALLVAMFNSQLEFQWVQSFDNCDFDCIGLAQNEFMAVIDYQDSLTLNVNGTSTDFAPSGDSHVVLARFQNDGNISSAWKIYSIGSLTLNSFCFDQDEHLIITGSFSDDQDFNPDSAIFSIPFSTAGEFAYLVKYGDGDTLLNISKNQELETIIYPNPAQQFIYIKLPENFNGIYAIYDLIGNAVLQKQLNESLIVINTDCFANGAYLFRAENNKQEVYFNKIIIAR